MILDNQMAIYWQLCKIRLTAMVLVSTAAGYFLASGWPIQWPTLLWTLLGVGLTASGAGALNQVVEVEQDALMQRTCRRPLPAGQISRVHAMVFAVVIIIAGLTVLNELVNPLTAALGIGNILIYVAVYTPLKRRTSLCTLVGSLCGSLLPLMGCTGAIGRFSSGPLLLAVILFFWQVPHFLSLAWLCRSDYAEAGFHILPVVDRDGRLTCLAITTYCLALMPLGLWTTLCGSAGYLFGAISLVLGFYLFLLALRLQTAKTSQNARHLFLATIIYLPLIMLFMVADMR
jgi:heme o synthase